MADTQQTHAHLGLKRSLAVVLGVLCALIVIAIYHELRTQNMRIRDIPDVIAKITSCAKEGESIGSCVDCTKRCCPGLRGMAKLQWQGKCIRVSPPGFGAVCSVCGNGVCDAQNSEDECNCPTDCPVPSGDASPPQ